jgi:predicted GIY-YIG superfamily endonuclease
MADRDYWYVYILRCGDGTLYTGIARNVAERLNEHASGRGARYTRGRGPLELCTQHRCHCKGDALRLEYAIKRLPRDEKLNIIAPRALKRFAHRQKSAHGGEA